MNIPEIYRLLMERFGPQGWWPGETSGEHLAGCVLAQNARWERVAPVIERLKRLGVLEGSRLLELPEEELSSLLRGSGTYRRKAEYLRGVWKFMREQGWDGEPASVKEDTGILRKKLLSLKGVGPETADCILLYVLERPVFVVDAYTKRILSRHGLCSENDSCEKVQRSFHRELETDTEVFREYHALLVGCAKEYCRPRPRCEYCPLSRRAGHF
jgi:endonuclease III related protein